MLSDRRSAILEALIDGYIRTGEPVSSRAVLDATGLGVSAATIRNELVALESEGYIAQPHTSAGRVPTDLGYRYFVDHISPGRIRSAIQNKIEIFFETAQAELSALLQQTSNLLAELTHYPALVLGPGLAGDHVHALHLVQLSMRAVLVVVVTEAGKVSKELVQLAQPVPPAEVAQAEELLAELFAHRAIDAAPSVVAALQKRDPAAGVLEVAAAAAAAVARSAAETRDVYLGGTSQLTSLWEDLAKVHRILELLEQGATINALLGEAGPGTRVKIGSELSLEDVDLAVVSAGYDTGSASGRIGVLGPMRMDYRHAINVVEEVGEGLAENLGG